MARISGVLTGAQAWYARVAQWFRGGPVSAAAGPIPPPPGRERVSDPQQLVERAIAAGVAPETSQFARESRRYICVFTDPDSGEIIARVPSIVEYDVGTPPSTIYSAARRAAVREYRGPYQARYLLVDPESLRWRNPPSISCRQIRGSRAAIPTVLPTNP